MSVYNSRAIYMKQDSSMYKTIRNFENYSLQTRSRIRETISYGAACIASEARNRAAYGATGNLIKGITCDVTTKEHIVKATVLAKSKHSYINEYGTEARYAHSYKGRPQKRVLYRGVMPARPFLQPAVTMYEDKIIADLQNVVKGKKL